METDTENTGRLSLPPTNQNSSRLKPTNQPPKPALIYDVHLLDREQPANPLNYPPDHTQVIAHKPDAHLLDHVVSRPFSNAEKKQHLNQMKRRNSMNQFIDQHLQAAPDAAMLRRTQSDMNCLPQCEK
jgi:hypothetical protein